jgi:hypothetical protein
LPKIKLCVKVNQVGCGSAFQLASLAKSGLPNKACSNCLESQEQNHH